MMLILLEPAVDCGALMCLHCYLQYLQVDKAFELFNEMKSIGLKGNDSARHVNSCHGLYDLRCIMT